MDEKTLHQLIDGIYDAALDSDRWNPFLNQFSAALHGNSCMWSQDAQTDEVGLVKYSETDLAYAQSYQEYYSQTNLWFQNMWVDKDQGIREGEMLLGSKLLAPAALEKTEFYSDWLKPQGLYECIATPLIVSGTQATTFALLRPRRRTTWHDHEAMAWKRLMPHLRRAMQVHTRLQTAQLRRDSALSALDHLKIGIVLTTEAGRILYANRNGEALLSLGRGLSVRFGRLCAENTNATERLQEAIRAAAMTGIGQGTSTGANLTLPYGGGPPLPVVISPVKGGDDRLEVGRGPTAMLLIADPDSQGQIAGDELSRLYGLTPSQARLLQCLLEGKRLSDYADEAQLSLNTVKSHMKQLFEKTGENRQSDLIRRVLANPFLKRS